MKRFILAAAGIFLAATAIAQIHFSGGAYLQNFNSLASSGTGNGWTNNVTLPGWYSSKSGIDSTNYSAGNGTSTTGGLYSFGTNSVNPASDRAIGSLGSGSASPVAYGVRFTNDTGLMVTNITVSFSAEQWRNGGSGSASTNVFSYGVSSAPITNSFSAAAWTNFAALSFFSPTVSSTTSALDGNLASNRLVFSGVVLAGVAVSPGSELFLRWSDADDAGNDSAMAIDDLTVTFQSGTNSPPPGTNLPPLILAQPQSQTAMVGDSAFFSVAVSGTAPFSYQWRSNNFAVPGATNAVFSLANITTNISGSVYLVTVTNVAGATNSQPAMLVVSMPVSPPSVFTNSSVMLMTYNVKGNGVSDWSTNTAQAQAIGRQLIYLNPDIITFNEIPHANVWQMTNWVAAFLPGFFLATNSGSDNYINSVIASRFPIIRSQKWLDGADLNPFGYTNANFTRDLFEAQINVPNWPLPLHVFTTHLKSSVGGYTDAAAKRAAEAAAITNFFATNFFVLHPTHPFTLSGDMNEADTNTLAIQRLVSTPITLRLTNPTNPFTGSINTYDSPSPNSRIDYIFPCGLLSSNVIASQVFRTDKLTPLPTGLLKYDSTNASDHLPVLMTFANPFNTPFRLLSVEHTNQNVTLKWESATNRWFSVETSTNLANWSVLAENLFATGTNFTYTTNGIGGKQKFFRIRRTP